MSDVEARRHHTQERGRKRRTALLAAARRLIDTKEIDEISLADVSELAGIPKSSAYHFFADIGELYKELATHLAAELQDRVGRTAVAPGEDWTEITRHFILNGIAYFNGCRSARQLLIGPKSPTDIKLSDRKNDSIIGEQLRDLIAAHFRLPPMEESASIFFFAIEVADLFCLLSVMEHDKVTPAFAEEAVRATIAYLKLYIPPMLAPIVPLESNLVGYSPP